MELYKLDSDILVMGMTAPRFPEDVPATYTRLEQSIANKSTRRYFGYSRPGKDGIVVYTACAEVLNADEPVECGLGTMTLKAGNYAAIYISNHYEDGANIPKAFEQLLKHPQLDPNGFCLEIYKDFTDPDVMCLVPIVTD